MLKLNLNCLRIEVTESRNIRKIESLTHFSKTGTGSANCDDSDKGNSGPG